MLVGNIFQVQLWAVKNKGSFQFKSALAWRERSDASGAENNDYNISHLGPFELDILDIFVLYLQNVVALAYIGTDNQFIPENDEFNSDDENAVQIEWESKQAAKFVKMEAKEQISAMNLLNEF